MQLPQVDVLTHTCMCTRGTHMHAFLGLLCLPNALFTTVAMGRAMCPGQDAEPAGHG